MSASPSLTDNFGAVSTKKSSKGRHTKPFSIRLTSEEKAYLEECAGRKALGAYCREVLLCEMAVKRRTPHNPGMNDTRYASLLAALGESRLSSNLNQLAKHANMGTIDISDDVEAQLIEAYHVIVEMRNALFMALGLKR